MRQLAMIKIDRQFAVWSKIGVVAPGGRLLKCLY
jgi:hypothetical protein